MAHDEADRLLSRQHFLAGKTIIVAGGGIAGLSFAASLRKLWDPSQGLLPRVAIYERDVQDISSQREGYTLSLLGTDLSGGLVALRKLALLDRAIEEAVAGLGGNGAFKIWNADWSEMASFPRKPVGGIPTASIRIARSAIRQILLEAAEQHTPEFLRWESQCISARRLDDGRVGVEVRHGNDSRATEEHCDLLVVADGANSKLRACMRPEDQLEYAGAVLRGGISRFEAAPPRPLDQDWGFVMPGTGVTCFYSPVDKHSVFWGVGHLDPQHEQVTDGNSPEALQAVIERAQELGAGFQEPFGTVVHATDLHTVLCLDAKDKMPFAHDRIEDMPAIFIGDSNHALSPFAGYGANLALSDGWDLAERLCRARTLKEAVAEYDAVSVPRATNIVLRSRRTLRAGHSTGWRFMMFRLAMVLTRFLRWIKGG